MNKNLSKMGELMQHWHVSMQDPVYAVGSLFFDNQHPKLSVVHAARLNIIQMLDCPSPSWSSTDLPELRRIRKFLDDYIAARIQEKIGVFQTCVRTELYRCVFYTTSIDRLTLRVFAELETRQKVDTKGWVNNVDAAKFGFLFQEKNPDFPGRVDFIYSDENQS